LIYWSASYKNYRQIIAEWIIITVYSNFVEMYEKYWNQMQEYIWKWYPVLIGIASFEEEKNEPSIT
jgi:hypothetical protein